MRKNWWPAPLSHIPLENPWGEKNIVVAEIKSFDEKPHAGHRRTFSALVPIAQIEDVKKNLANLDHDVSASGPHPYPDVSYNPKFWIGTRGLPREQYEPLVLSWSSHDKTVLQPDPRFLMTYGLAPRTGKDGSTFWDDPAEPMHDVVQVSAASTWHFPIGTTATVSISRDHLQDYLTLRNMALVQVFWELRWGSADADIERRLGLAEGVNIDFSDRRFQLSRRLDDRNIVAAQVWGGRVVRLPGGLPISENSLEKEGLIWPGFSKPVTDAIAQRLRPADQVYVDDGVLAAFEGKPGYRVNPESGSVTFGTQWAVGFCERIGRNTIRLELKKLYEGVRPNATRHWNRFAVEPPPREAHPAMLRERNIAIRAKEVTFAMVALGEALATLAQSAGLQDLAPEDFVGLRRRALEYDYWWAFEDTDAISRHVPLNLPLDAFLDRCMSLSKLISEGVSERNLRRLLQTIGVPSKEIATYGSLKLLDCIVRMAQVAHQTGLGLSENGILNWNRLGKEGTTPTQPIAHLFALYDIRVLKAHKAGDRTKNLTKELERFGVTRDEEASGYGKVLDRIYDALSAQLSEASAKIGAAL